MTPAAADPPDLAGLSASPPPATISNPKPGRLLAILPAMAWTDEDRAALGPDALNARSMAEFIAGAESEPPALMLIDASKITQENSAWLLHLRQRLHNPAIILASTAADFTKSAAWAQQLEPRAIYPLLSWRERETRQLWPFWRAWALAGHADDALQTAIGASGRYFTITFGKSRPQPLENSGWQNALDSISLPAEIASDLELCAEELVINAFEHGYALAAGAAAPAFKETNVEVTLGLGREWIGLCVRDAAGRLSNDKALATLSRQWGARGLLDEKGRGLYLAHTMGSALILNVHPGKSTEITVLFARQRPNITPGRPLSPLGLFERVAI